MGVGEETSGGAVSFDGLIDAIGGFDGEALRSDPWIKAAQLVQEKRERLRHDELEDRLFDAEPHALARSMRGEHRLHKVVQPHASPRAFGQHIVHRGHGAEAADRR